MSDVSRVSIPNNVTKMIQHIKEIAGNHSDEEIYATLKECFMDPNETIQKLLFQDTFHEVKRKRDKRKESNRESSEPRWKPASHGRGSRGGRGSYSPRYASHDSDRRNSAIGKENGIMEDRRKSSVPSLSPLSLAAENKTTTGENNPVIPLSSDGHAINLEIGAQQSMVVDTAALRTVSHETIADGNAQQILENEGGLVLNTSQVASPSSSITGTSGSRPSSNYSNRSQHQSTFIKAGPGKEWKPKVAIVNPASVSRVLNTTDIDSHSVEAINPKDIDNTAIIQKKLEDLFIADTKHVIIPDHLQVSESERSGLSFGSFDSDFSLSLRNRNEPDHEEIHKEQSEFSREVDETNEELASSATDPSKASEEKIYEADPQPSVPENQSVELEVPSRVSPPAESDGLQPSVAPSAPAAPASSMLGFTPPVHGGHYAVECADPQTHEATVPLQNFIVPQPFDPSPNYYASIYRPAIGGDGRFSPLLTPGATTKYNGTLAVLPAQSGQFLQESGSSFVLPSTGSTSLVTQPMQSSISASQQPVPIYRQPPGVHMSHYSPNFVHYSQYFSPFYVPSPAAVHHFLGNAAAFPQQPMPGNIFPISTAPAVSNSVKYPISQFKPAVHSGPAGQLPYGLNPIVYGSAVSGGNSTGSEDFSSQFKDNNVFMDGQQSEGSAVWMHPPPRDISNFQTGSFYNVSPQGQPVTFTGIYHPTPSLAAGSVHPFLHQPQAIGGSSELVGPPVGIYQQQRASPINWINNY